MIAAVTVLVQCVCVRNTTLCWWINSLHDREWLGTILHFFKCNNWNLKKDFLSLSQLYCKWPAVFSDIFITTLSEPVWGRWWPTP